LSQRKLFVGNVRPKDPSNASITTHAAAVVDVNVDASYEVLPFDNGNDDVIEIESDESSHIVCEVTTASTRRMHDQPQPQHQQHYYQKLQQLKPRNFHLMMLYLL
jgi:hypothetical protein